MYETDKLANIESTTMECFDDSIVFLKNERNKEGTRLQPLETLTVVLTLQMTTKENSYQILIYDRLLFEVYSSTPVISHPRVLKHWAGRVITMVIPFLNVTCYHCEFVGTIHEQMRISQHHHGINAFWQSKLLKHRRQKNLQQLPKTTMSDNYSR